MNDFKTLVFASEVNKIHPLLPEEFKESYKLKRDKSLSVFATKFRANSVENISTAAEDQRFVFAQVLQHTSTSSSKRHFIVVSLTTLHGNEEKFTFSEKLDSIEMADQQFSNLISSASDVSMDFFLKIRNDLARNKHQSCFIPQPNCDETLIHLFQDVLSFVPFNDPPVAIDEKSIHFFHNAFSLVPFNDPPAAINDDLVGGSYSTFVKFDNFDAGMKNLMSLMFTDFAAYVDPTRLKEFDDKKTSLMLPRSSALVYTMTQLTLSDINGSSCRKIKLFWLVVLKNLFKFLPFKFEIFHENTSLEEVSRFINTFHRLPANKKLTKLDLQPFQVQIDRKLSVLDHQLMVVDKKSEIFKQVERMVSRIDHKFCPKSICHCESTEVHMFKFDTTPTADANTMLLWHGTDTLDVYSILKEGYKTRDQLNNRRKCKKALFYADRIEKASSYCCDLHYYKNKKQVNHLLLLNEVQLGTSKMINSLPTSFKRSHLEKISQGHDSVIFNGGIIANPKDGKFFDEFGAHLLIGDTQYDDQFSGSDPRFNEYVVFNKNRVKVRYVVHLIVKRRPSPPAVQES